MKFPKQLILVYLCNFIDALGYSFVLPILPYYLERVGGNSTDLGLLTSIYAITQAISSLAMGSLSDKQGRKPYIILSLFGSFTGPLLQAFSPNVIVFFITRAYTGLLGGSQTICQAYIGDIIPPAERSTFIAYSTALVGFSFVIGPLLGGVLSTISLEVPFYACSILAFIVFILSIFFVRETNKRVIETRELKTEKKQLLKKAGLNEEESKRVDEINKKLDEIVQTAKTEEKPKLKWNKYIIMADLQRFFNDSGVCIFSSMYSQFLKDEMNTSSFDNSMIFFVTGVITLLTQVFLFPLFHGKLHMSYISISIIGGIFIMAGWLLMAFIPVLWVEYITSCIMYVGFSLLCPISPSLLSIHATSKTQGVSMSTGVLSGQIAMIIIPIIAGLLYSVNSVVTIACGALFGFLISLQMATFVCVPGGKDLEKPSYPEEFENDDDKKDIESQGVELDKNQLKENDASLSISTSNIITTSPGPIHIDSTNGSNININTMAVSPVINSENVTVTIPNTNTN